MKSFHELQKWILDWVERELHVQSSEIATDVNLLNYGMDSVTAIMLVGDLESQLGLRLSPTLVWDHASVDALAQFVLTNASDAGTDDVAIVPDKSYQELSLEEAQQLLQNIDQLSDDQVTDLLARLSADS